MANPSDLERVRSAIEALNVGTIPYSEFEAIVASVVAAGSMTREDVRHELEVAHLAENVRRDPPARPTDKLNVAPDGLISARRRARPKAVQLARARRPWLMRLGIFSFFAAMVGGFVWFMIPRLDLHRDPVKSDEIPTDSSPNSTIAATGREPASEPAQPAPSAPPPTIDMPPPAATGPTSGDVAARASPSTEQRRPTVSVPATAVAPRPADQPSTVPVPTMRREDPDSPPLQSRNSPHLVVAQGYESFADLCPYPRGALAKGETGTVGLLAYVSADGRIFNTAIVKSSGSDELDMAAAMCLKDKGRFEPKSQAGQATGYWGRTTFNWSFGQ